MSDNSKKNQNDEAQNSKGSKSLPDSPNWDHLRKQAKAWLKKIHSGDTEATSWWKNHRQRESEKVILADVQDALAFEYGFQSWPRMKVHVESLQETREQRLLRLRKALMMGQRFIVDELIELDSSLQSSELAIQIAMGDESVISFFEQNPDRVSEKMGPRTPLLHLCFSRYFQVSDTVQKSFMKIARALIRIGASPNESYAMFQGSDHQVSALYGALGHSGHFELAEFLLESGAEPDDGESLYHATELDSLEGLRLMIKYNANPEKTNALYRALDFDRLDAVRMLIEHGADVNETLAQYGHGEGILRGNTLHHAIRRMRSGAFIELLIDQGVDTSAQYFGHSPYALACIYNNHSAAEALQKRGLETKLSDTENLLTLCVSGDAEAAQKFVDCHPDVLSQLNSTDRLLHTELAKYKGYLSALKAMHLAGFDPMAIGESDMPAVHHAAWFGLADYVEFYAPLEIDFSYKNMYGGDVMGTLLHGSTNCPDAHKGNYIECAKALLAAGCPAPTESDLDMASEDLRDYFTDL